MKLSKAQEEVLQIAKMKIDFARTHTFYEWERKCFPNWFENLSDEEIDKKLLEYENNGYHISKESEMKRFEQTKQGIHDTCHASSATIRKLEKLGLIEILKDSNGEYYGFDTIKVLNY